MHVVVASARPCEPLSYAGGAERSLQSVVRTSIERGHRVTMIATAAMGTDHAVARLRSLHIAVERHAGRLEAVHAGSRLVVTERAGFPIALRDILIPGEVDVVLTFLSGSSDVLDVASRR